MLWNLFKHLKNKAPIYIGVMDEDENSIPNKYVILEDMASDVNFSSGDGKSLLRDRTYNIRIYAIRKAEAESVIKEYRKVLLEKGIPFNQLGPTYDPTSAFYSTLITGDIVYGV